MRLRIAGVLAGALSCGGMSVLGGCAGADIQEGLTGFSAGVQSMGNEEGSATQPATTDDTESGESSDTDDTAGEQSGSDPSDPTADPTADDTDPTDPTDPTGCVPGDEVCDGDDNDCDGDVDEDDPGVGLPCDTGMPGACGAGTQQCSDGALSCVGEVTPTAETCNGQDDDCDGTADQGNPGGGGACETGQPGICAAGTSQCQSGGVTCVQNQAAGAESCNGQDDNCDGNTDEGNPGGGAGCSTGLPGICAAGTQTCQQGGLVCAQNQNPVGEACGDGQDNDCDGAVDNGCGCAHDLCTAGAALVSGCDPCVTSVCGADPYCCSTSWDGICVGEVSSVCGNSCPGTCAHDLCATGDVLVAGCDPAGCVTSICGSDAYCCNTAWDAICVGEVSSICALAC